MRLGLALGYSGSHFSIDLGFVQHAERLGFHSVWSAEAYGSDAVVPLAWVGAHTSTIKLATGIMQLPGRTPANTAMTAMTLDHLSGGRFVLGLGTSGPQVVEGWHGVPFGDQPLGWLREYIEIVRKIFAREAPLTHHGRRYRIPYDGPDASGLGKPLKSILHGRKDIPIYTGSMAPKSQEQAAELADGMLLTSMHPEHFGVIDENVQRGFAKAGGGKGYDRFDVTPAVSVVIGDDLDACRLPLKMVLALYVGGMGAKNKNFYNAYLRRIGYEETAERVQELYLAGRKNEAIAAIPDRLIDELNLVGPKERIRERFSVWKGLPVGTLLVATAQREALELMAELVQA